MTEALSNVSWATSMEIPKHGQIYSAWIRILPCMLHCYLVYTWNIHLNILKLKFTLLDIGSYPWLCFEHTNTNFSYSKASVELKSSRKHDSSLSCALFPYLTPYWHFSGKEKASLDIHVPAMPVTGLVQVQ